MISFNLINPIITLNVNELKHSALPGTWVKVANTYVTLSPSAISVSTEELLETKILKTAYPIHIYRKYI